MANLESRIEVLERCTPREQFTVFVRQIVRPGNLTPANTFCEIEGVYYTRPDDESPADFDARMLALACSAFSIIRPQRVSGNARRLLAFMVTCQLTSVCSFCARFSTPW